MNLIEVMERFLDQESSLTTWSVLDGGEARLSTLWVYRDTITAMIVTPHSR